MRTAAGAPRHRVAKRRSPLAFIGIAVAVGAVALYGVVSAVSWNDLDDQVSSWSSETQELLDHASIDAQRPVHERAAEIDDIRSTLDAIHVDPEALCTPRAVVRWQSGVIIGSDREMACQRSVHQVAPVAAALDDVVTYLEDANAVAAAISGLTGQSRQANEEDFETIVASWQQARTEVAELDVSDGFTETRDETVAALDEVVRAWEALVEANEEQNLVAFVEARENLEPAYAALSGLGETGSARLEALDEEFLAAYRIAYANLD